MASARFGRLIDNSETFKDNENHHHHQINLRLFAHPLRLRTASTPRREGRQTTITRSMARILTALAVPFALAAVPADQVRSNSDTAHRGVLTRAPSSPGLSWQHGDFDGWLQMGQSPRSRVVRLDDTRPHASPCHHCPPRPSAGTDHSRVRRAAVAYVQRLLEFQFNAALSLRVLRGASPPPRRRSAVPASAYPNVSSATSL